MKREKEQGGLAPFLLRTGLATVFLYAAVSTILDPTAWIGFIPPWLRTIIPQTLFLAFFDVYQIGLSLWLLSGRKTYAASLVAAGTLLLIVLVNIRALDLVFRDVAILFAALALAALSKEK